MAVLSNADLREALVKAHSLLDHLNRKVIEDHQEQLFLPTYPDYAKHAPSVYLDRARNKLAKKGYKVAFAGAMKGGKSTLINALLRAPGLLPAAVYECTLSLTLVAAPAPGQQERVEVTYFSREVALRNLLENVRYRDLFEDSDALLEEFDSGAALLYIGKRVRELRQESEKQEQLEELYEFCQALETYHSRLGKVHIDTLDNAPHYLTVDAERKGMGHLLLIHQVAIFKNNPIFTANGIEVVDLPGTDSTNPRQRELTHSFMEEADVVFLILEPKGFTEAAKRITEKLKGFNQEIRNKMFVVLNRWDTLQERDLLKEHIESLYINEIKARTIKWGLRPDRIFLTSALWQELKKRQELGIITEEETASLQRLSTSAAQQLERLDDSIASDLLQRLGTVYQDGGITHLRAEMTRYLKEDIERERLRDIYLDLKTVYELAHGMLEPERAAVQELLEEARNRLIQVSKFLDEVMHRFDERVCEVDEKVEGAVGAFVNQARDQLLHGLKMLVKADNRHLSLRKIKNSLSVPSPARIKREAIVAAKEVLSGKILESIESTCVPPVIQKVLEEVGALKIERIFDHFDKHLKTKFRERYDRILTTLERDLRQATRLRALEESWSLQSTEMQPAGVEGVWTRAIEEEFREVLLNVFTERIGVHTRRLQGTLGRYYRHLLSECVREFERLVTEVSKVARHAHDVPLPSLDAGPGGRDRNQALIEYFTFFDEAGARLGNVGLGLDTEEQVPEPEPVAVAVW